MRTLVYLGFTVLAAAGTVHCGGSSKSKDAAPAPAAEEKDTEEEKPASPAPAPVAETPKLPSCSPKKQQDYIPPAYSQFTPGISAKDLAKLKSLATLVKKDDPKRPFYTETVPTGVISEVTYYVASKPDILQGISFRYREPLSDAVYSAQVEKLGSPYAPSNWRVRLGDTFYLDISATPVSAVYTLMLDEGNIQDGTPVCDD